MEDTWAAGPIEQLRHASSHISRDSAFDRRIAFVSIDNAVELTMKAFLTMPRRTRGSQGIPPEEFAAIEDSFPGILDACSRIHPRAFEQAPPLDIEHYHRIRNTLYHEGTGLTVSEAYVKRYFSIATSLLLTLLRVEFRPEVDRLSNLRPEVRKALRESVEAERRRQHSAAVKAGLEPARAAGRLRGRGGRVSGPSPEEATIAVELHAKGWGYKRIADELTRRRRLKKGPADADGEVYVVAYQKVRRKLVELGVVKRVSERGYL